MDYGQKGEKRIEIVALQGKRQIIAVMCGSLMGMLLPFQLTCTGKTSRCHSTYKFCKLHIRSTNHWSNEETVLQYIQDIIIPFVDETQQNIGADEKQPALAIFDHFKGQMTERVIQKPEDNYIYSVLIPANYKGLLQLMDVSVNKVVKS